MLYLLQLCCDKEVRLLPVAERTAAQLERALLVGVPMAAANELLTALRSDPYLAIATLQLAEEREEAAAAGSPAAAAEWLSQDLASKLARPMRTLIGPAQTARQVAAPVVPPPDATRYARLAGEVCAQGAGPAASTSEADKHYWSAVLAARQALLASCPTDSWGGPRLLPSFAPAPPSAAGLSSSAEHPIQSYLLDSVPDVAWRLPALVARLAEADTSEGALAERLEQEKLASMRQLAYGASHEINNPLANIVARAQALQRDERDPQRYRKLQAIYDQAMRAHEMIADLMLFAHPPELVTGPCRLGALVEQVVAEWQADAEHRQVELTASVPPAEILFTADETQLAVALSALVRNALEAIGQGGHVEVRAAHSGEEVRILVRDDGPGIPPEVRRHMFDPFYSGREAGRGLGFGLSKCWRIVTMHGGKVTVQPAPQRGSDITLLLPAAEAISRAA